VALQAEDGNATVIRAFAWEPTSSAERTRTRPAASAMKRDGARDLVCSVLALARRVELADDGREYAATARDISRRNADFVYAAIHEMRADTGIRGIAALGGWLRRGRTMRLSPG
jgi:hypothetical protein